MSKRLYRSKTDRKLFGVCGGVAKYFGIDPVIIRILAIASIFFGLLGVVCYLVAAIIVPEEP